MKPRQPAGRKAHPPEPARRCLLSVRSALVLALAVLAALGGAGLLLASHRPPALIALGSAGIFAGALKLLDSVIE